MYLLKFQSMTNNYPASGTEYKLYSNNNKFYTSDGIGSVLSDAIIYFSDGTNTGSTICLNLIPYADPR